MEHQNHNTKSRKNKHLNFKKRHLIEIGLKECITPYRIAKELSRPINTILNEINRGTVTQIKQGKYVQMCLADAGEANYKRNRLNSCLINKRLECGEFISYAVNQIKENSWSLDTCFGEALETGRFNRSEMVCTKTLYNYIDLCLLDVKNFDLPLKLRRNTKPSKTRAHKKSFGRSITGRPSDIETREKFDHWEIDTVIGKKIADDCVLMILGYKTPEQLFETELDRRYAV